MSLTDRINDDIKKAMLAREKGVVDNGGGFDTKSMLRLDYLLEHKHFGLAGMVERALLIGARLKINSDRGTGTQVTIQWASQN